MGANPFSIVLIVTVCPHKHAHHKAQNKSMNLNESNILCSRTLIIMNKKVRKTHTIKLVVIARANLCVYDFTYYLWRHKQYPLELSRR